LTTRVCVSSWNAASLPPPSLETVIGTLTSTRWLRRRLDSDPPLIGSQVDMGTTLKQWTRSDKTMPAGNTQSVNCMKLYGRPRRECARPACLPAIPLVGAGFGPSGLLPEANFFNQRAGNVPDRDVSFLDALRVTRGHIQQQIDFVRECAACFAG
jgi:hypothetical protein